MNDKVIISEAGSGGIASRDLIKNIFLSRFNKNKFRLAEDAAVIENGKYAFTTDSFVIKPAFFPGGNIGKLAFCGTANDLSVRGAIPKYMTFSCIIPEGYSVKKLTKIVDSFQMECETLKVEVLTGDTKVVNSTELSEICINTTGIGIMTQDLSIGNVSIGDHIIVSGFLGDHTAAVISHREGLFIDDLPKSDCAPVLELVQSAISAVNGMSFFCRDITRGGVGAICQELADEVEGTVNISVKAIPVRDSVKEFCNLTGLPFTSMANEGKICLAVPAEYVDSVLKKIRSVSGGEYATDIGIITPGISAVINTDTGQYITSNTNIPRIC